MEDRKIFQLLVDVRGGTHVVHSLQDEKHVPIEVFEENGTKWYRQGDSTYNGRYVISIVYFAKDALVNGEPI